MPIFVCCGSPGGGFSRFFQFRKWHSPHHRASSSRHCCNDYRLVVHYLIVTRWRIAAGLLCCLPEFLYIAVIDAASSQ
ncbi:hypothetical protein [Erwinia tracheiphila]|uniref:hypothetical protein n=1 Tax=Erwinia tracheiphila TaxID=65700 RepID=UPI0012F746E2